MTTATRCALVAAAAMLPVALASQTPGSSARAIGMGGAYTTLARGYEAAAWNPAMLGMPGRPKWSVNFGQAQVAAYSNAFSLGDLNRWSSGTLTTADKDSILALIRSGDPDRPLILGSGVDATTLSLSVGNFALTLSGFAELQTAIADDAVEIALFGNASRRTPGATYEFAGSGGDAMGGLHASLSYGRRLNVMPTGILAVGATARLSRGVFIGRVTDVGSSLQNAPNFDADLRIHALVADLDSSTNHGSGLGLDLGATYEMLSGMRFGLVIENAISRFSWSDENLLYYRYAYLLRQTGDTYEDSTIAEIEGVAFNANDPVQRALRDSMFGDAHPPTRVRAGTSLDLGGVVVAGDLTVRLRSGILDAGDKRVAAGAELTLIPILRPRFGLATDLETGFAYAVGLGLSLGPLRTDWALSMIPGGSRKGFVLAVGMSLIS
ncbi:MAG: DUF5723 family protein [Gemmatimonadales bacterium]